MEVITEVTVTKLREANQNLMLNMQPVYVEEKFRDWRQKRSIRSDWLEYIALGKANQQETNL